ncbi:Lcl domain-containing protein [Candidatus Venteria ishoeyi]|uniref:Tol-pal system protein YbgF n=1 Tax=Candidatus Venteria ishoeyi TaxID=1899563 RepID=A0A1H6FJP8_9GAMM|nr:DUF1566 domain-containing protein [Candidatus Venteria ishoeyi]SEH09157.1 tol-pal system protein YbgF [Candidatus Venteria ishoeyi]SEH09286.1 tol-pal system protein YbgF [Candidatus Venteria ishoeyi]
MQKILIPLLLLCFVALAAQAWDIPFLNTDESKAEELYNKALDLEVQDQSDKALLYYQDILTRYPDTETAKAVRKKLAEAKESEADVIYQKVLQAEARQDFTQALVYCRELINRYPDTRSASEAQNKLADLEQAQQVAQARQQQREAEQQQQEAQQAINDLYQKALQYEALQDFNNARLYYLDVLNRYPGSSTAQAAQAKLNKLPTKINRYLGYPDGTAKDMVTELMWMRCSVGQKWNGSTCVGKAQRFKWDDAKAIHKTFAGYNDWRLPSIKELRTLVYCSNGKPHYLSMGKDANNNYSGCQGESGKDHDQPTIVKAIFPNTPSGRFWSSSPHADMPGM